MDFLKSIASDLLNGFSANDIPVFLARIFFAAVLAFVIKLIFKRKYKEEEASLINHLVLLSIAISIVVPIAQFSISLGLIIAGFIVALLTILRGAVTSKEAVYTLIGLLLASSIGAGYVLYSLIGAFLILVYSIISKD